MNIFYSQKTLKNNLIGIVNKQPNLIKKIINNDWYFLDENNEIIGFNINLNDGNFKLNDGRIFLTEELKEIIEKRSNLKLKNIKSGFFIGKIIDCEPIEGTHLHKCIVDIGQEKLNIVCGAKNARVGLLTVVATVNTIMDSCLEIKPSKLKGFDSNGMLCSQKELNLTGFNEEGIVELDQTKYQVGEIFKPLYKNL